MRIAKLLMIMLLTCGCYGLDEGDLDADDADGGRESIEVSVREYPDQPRMVPTDDASVEEGSDEVE